MEPIVVGKTFTPYVITVNPGEDVVAKISQTAKEKKESLTVLHAKGILKVVKLAKSFLEDAEPREDKFPIISISGTCFYYSSSQKAENLLSTILMDSEGSLIGGHVVGPLIAGGVVQLVLAGFFLMLPDYSPSADVPNYIPTDDDEPPEKKKKVSAAADEPASVSGTSSGHLA